MTMTARLDTCMRLEKRREGCLHTLSELHRDAVGKHRPTLLQQAATEAVKAAEAERAKVELTQCSLTQCSLTQCRQP